MEEYTYSETPGPRLEDIKDPFCDPQHPCALQFADVEAAKELIQDGITRTPCYKSRLSEDLHMELYFKMEFYQYTGSFKERGARNALLKLNDQQKAAGVVSASLGNHALAICYHGFLLKIPVTVVMPVVAPLMKIAKCREFKATVSVEGKNMTESKQIALRLAKASGKQYINGNDHPDIMAGQGTIGMEIVEQVEDVDAVVIPVGGGGLLAGISVAIKHLKPDVQIIGVESDKCSSFSSALAAGRPVLAPLEATIADGLAVPLVGSNAFLTARDLIDKMIAVDEEFIALAVLKLIETQKSIVEGGGAVPLAAILAGQLRRLKGKTVVLVLSGGNIDTSVLGRCIERGLAADGRLLKLKIQISDRPGGLQDLAQRITDMGVSIQAMSETRAWVCEDIFSVEATVVCETNDLAHGDILERHLQRFYKKIAIDF